MKGNLTDCVTGEVREIELSYKITNTESINPERSRIFNLIGGVTGYESFYVKDEYIKKIIKFGWHANVMLRNKYDDLHIPAEEMEKAFVESGCMVGGEHEKKLEKISNAD